MRRSTFIIFVLALLAILFWAIFTPSSPVWKTDNAANLRITGIPGEHLIKLPADSDSVLKSIVARPTFFKEAHVEGKDYLSFVWNYKLGEEEILISSKLPKEKFQTVIDASRAQPTVEFIFAQYFLESEAFADGAFSFRGRERLGLSEVRHNPNALLENPELLAVKVRISREQRDREVYLP